MNASLGLTATTVQMAKTRSVTARNWHPKSKTGCSTCKSRRIKCDETRPVCLRCKRAGRDCLGYQGGLQPPNPSVKELKIVRSKYDYLMLSPSLSPDPKEESGLLCFFLNVTLPSITNYMPCRVWQESNVRHQLSNSSFRDLAVAIAVHHQSIEKSGPSATVSAEDVAGLKTYSKALTATHSLIERGDINLKTAIFGNIFVIILECMRGSGEALKIHLLNGLRVLRMYGILLDRYTLSEFHQIYATISLSCMLQHADAEVFAELELIPPVELPAFSPLVDFARLRAATGRLIIRTYCCVAKVALNYYRDKIERDAAFLQAYQELNRMEVELESCTLIDRPDSLSIRNLVAAKLMMCRIFLDTCIAGKQTAYDRHNETFRKIVGLMAEIFQHRAAQGSPATERPWSFSFGSGIMAIMTFAVTVCRHPQIRRDALKLLEMCPRKEGLRSSADTARIGRALMKFEEGNEDPMDENFTIPESRRVHYPRFEPASEIQPFSVIYGLCRPDAEANFKVEVIPIDSLSI